MEREPWDLVEFERLYNELARKRGGGLFDPSWYPSPAKLERHYGMGSIMTLAAFAEARYILDNEM